MGMMWKLKVNMPRLERRWKKPICCWRE